MNRLPSVPAASWHALSADACLEGLASTSAGLDPAEAASRLASFGENRLPRGRQDSVLRILLRQFLSPLIYLLLGAAVLSLAIGEARDALFIAAVLIVNAAIGTVQESRSERSAQLLGRFVEGQARCRRGGALVTLPAVDLVPGDVVLVESGDAVPADLRLLAGQGLSVDEAALTGESLPVGKRHDAEVAADCGTAGRLTMLHAGTVVLAGRGEGVVVATAAGTEVGRIAGALATTSGAKPPLVRRLEILTQRLSLLAVAGVLLFTGLEVLRGQPFESVILIAVALAVSAIPEGLPVAVTVTLSIARARMAQCRVIVRSLPAVEGLGACTVIASDKTGTLTANSLTVALLVLPDGRRVPAGEAAAAALARCATLCCEATLRLTADGTEQRTGDSVDLAFLDLARGLGLDWQRLQDQPGRRMLIPYEPHLRLAAALLPASDGAELCVKGASETLFALSGAVPAALAAQAEALAQEGYRVLAVAGRRLAEVPEGVDAVELLPGLELLGLAALEDPIRPEVPAAIAACHAGGIRVVMVTGDHPATALAIARRLGIATATDEVATGRTLATLRDAAAFDGQVAATRVFARVEPLQKLEIVEALQRLGHFVAVTGDGVNDAPALKAANLGVAMGRGGTDVARETADLILTDDNFASIVAGVAQGRIAYANVRKVVLLLLATGLAEVVLFVVALLASLPLPLFATQLLWLNLVTNGAQDVALGFEPGEPGLASQRPRHPNEPILDPVLRNSILILGVAMGLIGAGYFALLLAWQVPEDTARTALLVLLVLLENVAGLACRSETRSLFSIPLLGNPVLAGSILLALGLQALAFLVPWLAGPLRLESLDWELLWPLLPLLGCYLAVTEASKAWLRRRRPQAVA